MNNGNLQQSVVLLLGRLKRLNCRIQVDGERLKIKGSRENLTPDLLAEIRQQKQAILDFLADTAEDQPWEQIEPIAPEEEIPLSFTQQRLWFLEHLEGSGTNYNISAALRIEGELNLHALEQAFLHLVERHQALRSTFPSQDGVAVVRLRAPYQPLTVLTAAEQGERGAEDWLQAEIERFFSAHFDLSEGPLFCAELIRLDGAQQLLLFSIHHIISDGRSIQILVEDVVEYYSASVEERDPQLRALPIQFGDYAVWQRRRLDRELIEQEGSWWKRQLSDVPELLELPLDYARPARFDSRGHLYEYVVEGELLEQTRLFAQKQGTTLFMTLLATFQLLLFRYSGVRIFTVGIPTLGRDLPEVESLVGFFANTLVIRAQIAPSMRFVELLGEVSEAVLSADSHSNIPFEQVVESVNPQRSLSYSPLYQVMFSLQSDNLLQAHLPGVEISETSQRISSVKCDLTLNLVESKGQLLCQWEYATALFKPETIERMGEHFRNLLMALLREPEQEIGRLMMIGEQEYQKLRQWRGMKRDYPSGKSIVELFEEQVVAHADKVALRFSDAEMSYRQLEQSSNHLAHTLLEQYPPGEDGLVGLCMERSMEMVVGMLAVLKAGGAYLPLDPDYPADRLRYMVEDSGIDVILTQRPLRARLPSKWLEGLDIPLMEIDAEGFAMGYRNTPPALQSTPESLAYVTYTSGSTGVPKGVCIPQRAVVRLVCNTRYVSLDSEQVLIQNAPLSFDAATFEIWGALLNGGELVILSPRRDRFDSLGATIEAYGVTIAFMTNALFYHLLEHQSDKLATLDRLLVGGEAMSLEQINRAIELIPQVSLANIYGPTENTTFSTWYDISETCFQHPVPIGIPISNSTAFVVDEMMQPVPVGVPGELLVGGDGLARGYWNRPELTAERFIEVDLLGSRQRVYRTGDRVRWLESGDIEFMGRTDHQIKLRGLRIELGEVEAVLRTHPDVRDAVVTVHQEGTNRFLFGYLTSNSSERVVDGAGQFVEMLKGWLRERLPDYMVPAGMLLLEEMPLGATGKIDRKGLPAPGMLELEGVAPRNEREAQLAACWSRLLGLEVNDVTANFFELGGHSLLATQLAARIREQFKQEMPLRVLFEHPVLESQAHWLEQHTVNGEEIEDSKHRRNTIQPLPPGAPLQLSFAQQRLWLLEQIEGASATYNISAGLRISGTLEQEILQGAFRELVIRHQSLRQIFPGVDGAASVELLPPYEALEIESVAIGTEEIESQIESFSGTPFDIAAAPPFRARLLSVTATQDAPPSWLLLLNMHHIIADGWSLGILIEEISGYYSAGVEGGHYHPAPLAIQYVDYAAWQRQHLQGETLQQQIDWWREQLAGAPEQLELPVDHPRPPQQSYRGAVYHDEIDAESTHVLKQYSQQQGATLFMTLLGAYGLLLSRYSAQQDISIGTPIAGRIDKECEGLIGLFVNTLVMRIQLEPESGFEQLLEQIRHTTLGAYSHQEIPFEQLVDELNPLRSLSHAPLFQVMFALQNTPRRELQLPGVEIQPLEYDNPIAKFDLTLNVEEREGVLRCSWEYASDLFDAETIERMGGHYRRLLQEIVKRPSRPLGELELLSEAERQQYVSWNDTAVTIPAGTLVERFESWARRVPEGDAVVTGLQGEQCLSYAELNRRANRLAHQLIEQHGVGPDKLVGLSTERSEALVVGLLGILKAGGAYVPIDPNYPRQRIQIMLEESGVELMVTERSLQPQLSQSGVEALCLDTPQLLESSIVEDENPPLRSGLDDLAYVIYTSGSTGRPKGVMIEHRALINLLDSFVEETAFGVGQRLLAVTTLSFDIAALELYMPLISGGTVWLAGREMAMDGALLKSILQGGEVDVMQATPSTWQMLLNSGWGESDHNALTILCGGEALPQPLAEQLIHRCHRLLNVYGPTETTIWSTTNEIPQSLEDAGSIGSPIANTGIYILDTNHQQLPVGVIGELYISGTGLARGYWRRPDLTQERFIELERSRLTGVTNPETSDKAEKIRLYRSGDRARCLANGKLEYLGRVDHQVKLRGFRIELGEIEALLRRHPQLVEGVVTLYEEGQRKMLVAYVTLRASTDEEDQQSRVDGWRRWLRERLPEYMVPAQFVELESIPLTPNGKADRKQLLPPKQLSKEAMVVPTSEAERLFYRIWKKVLRVEELGIRSNFFELGGDSIITIQVVSQAREEGYLIRPRDLFEYQTIEELARVATTLDQSDAFTDESEPEGEGGMGLFGEKIDEEDLSAILDQVDGIG